MIAEIIAVFFLLLGTFFMLVGSIGLVRMPDLYTRMHAVTKCATLGVTGLLLAAVFSLASWNVTIKVALAISFHFLTNPVGAHMIARASYHHLRVKFWHKTIAEEWDR